MVSAVSGRFITPQWCQSWWPCALQSRALGVPAVAFLQMPLPSEIDELIVGLLPVCLCPVRRRPGYGWESQLWHLPWGYYCNRPAGGPGGLNPGCSSDPHTAVTPLETQRHSPRHGPLIGSDRMTLCGVQQFHRETT